MAILQESCNLSQELGDKVLLTLRNLKLLRKASKKEWPSATSAAEQKKVSYKADERSLALQDYFFLTSSMKVEQQNTLIPFVQ